MKISDGNLNQLKRLEESLWVAKTRFDKEYMDKILAVDFFEFGRSGKVYGRQQIIDVPAQKIDATLKNFKIHQINEEVFLITYVSDYIYNGKIEIASRSSLWIKTPEGWKLRFHQGTPVKE